MKLGFFYTVFNEKKAVEFSIENSRKHYPDSPIYLVSEGVDFSYLKEDYAYLETLVVDDTMSDTFKINQLNFKDDVNQYAIKKATFAVIERLKKCIDFCKSDYIIMMDPDAYIRGTLNIPDGVKLLGSRVNQGLPYELKNVLSQIGATVIDHWGATPGIFEVNSFLKAVERFEKLNIDIFTNSFYAMYAHDVLLPVLFALIGEEETYNPDIIECHRDHDWRFKNNPLVHQFREYY
jgi:hypothetical protein